MLFSPYHAAVRIVLRRAFADLSAGKTESIAEQFRPNAELRFSGDHALGGEMRGREAIGAWFARFHRLFPNLTLVPLAIVVNGVPWATTVATRFRVEATLPGGVPYANEGMQYLRLRWGAIVEDRLYGDTQHLVDALQAIAASGNPEALAPSLAVAGAAASP